jgi:putative dehydrogenase
MGEVALPIGVIGVGAMGSAVARRLLACGVETHVRDIRPEAMQELAAEGAYPHGSPAALAACCRGVVVLVVDALQIEDVLFGVDGAAQTLQAGTLVILSSTIAPADADCFARRLRAQGALVLDAPISGGPARAALGEISMMVAGEPKAWEAAQAILPLFSGRVFRVSERPGDGARFKLVNNMLAGINLAAGAEAFVLGRKLGLSAGMLNEVISASSGASWIVAERMQRVLAGDTRAQAATRMLAKDLGLVQVLAQEAGIAVPFAKQANSRFQELMQAGLGDVDDSVLIRQAGAEE